MTVSLEDYATEMNYCSRCSHCKFIPLNHIQSERYAYGCPSIARYNFHTYSGGGRVIAANSIRLGRTAISEELLDIIYRCQMCGACNIPCHSVGEVVEPLDIMRELRTKCVEDGHLVDGNIMMIDSLRKEDNTLSAKREDRSLWSDGLHIKDLDCEKADVLLHVGCQFSYDEELRPVIRNVVEMLDKAGVDFGVFLRGETCCGGRAFDCGYRSEIEKFAEDMASRVRASGASKLVTACSDCFGTFRQHYPQVGKRLEGVEIVHISSFVKRLVDEGRIEPRNKIGLRVTYHDPCRLGRLGEDLEPWNGEYALHLGGVIIPEPEKQRTLGGGGIYDAPRELLRSIPGIELREMERIREFSWCCGAGGGARENFPEYSMWTARERIEEAKATGAEAIVTSCPWCERHLKDAVEESKEGIEVFDVMDLVRDSI